MKNHHLDISGFHTKIILSPRKTRIHTSHPRQFLREQIHLDHASAFHLPLGSPMSHGRPRRGSLLKVFLPWRVTADLGWHEAKRDEVASLVVHRRLLSSSLSPSSLLPPRRIHGNPRSAEPRTRKRRKRKKKEKETGSIDRQPQPGEGLSVAGPRCSTRANIRIMDRPLSGDSSSLQRRRGDKRRGGGD